jgi:hypothetical protein
MEKVKIFIISFITVRRIVQISMVEWSNMFPLLAVVLFCYRSKLFLFWVFFFFI